MKRILREHWMECLAYAASIAAMILSVISMCMN